VRFELPHHVGYECRGTVDQENAIRLRPARGALHVVLPDLRGDLLAGIEFANPANVG